MTLGKRSTAEEALRGKSLAGLNAIVTGANSGLGVETTRVLALAGANVTMAVRSVDGGEKVRAQLEASLPKGAGKISVAKLDLQDLVSIRAFAPLSSTDPLDVLINNAGIMATPLGFTAQGFEQQMGTNHLGHFLLTQLLRPRLEKSKAARVVALSSDLHRRGTTESMLATLETDAKYEKRKYVPFQSYGDSKLANVLFARGLAKRLPANVKAYSVHPGVIPTNLSRSMGVGGAIFRVVGRLFMKTVEQGSATSIYGATAPEIENQSGAYLFDCKVKEPQAAALNDQLVDQLWTISERLVQR